MNRFVPFPINNFNIIILIASTYFENCISYNTIIIKNMYELQSFFQVFKNFILFLLHLDN